MPGTLLKNPQTQLPEWVEAGDVSAKLEAGWQEVAGGTRQELSPETEVAVPARELAGRETAGAVLDAGERAASEARRARQVEAYDNLADEALTFVDGAVDTATLGLVSGVGQEGEQRLRAEANPYARVAGALAAIGASVVGPATGLMKAATPLGVTSRGAAKAGEALAEALGKGSRGARGVLSRAAGMGVEGAIDNGAFAAGHAINDALNDRPVSGDAIIDDAGLGFVLGGGLGVVGGALGRSAEKIQNARREVKAAGEVLGDRAAFQVLGDGANAWQAAHELNRGRMAKLGDLVESGAMGNPEDADLFLADRQDALKAADDAHKRLMRAAGAKDMAGVNRRLEAVFGGSAKASPKEVERLAAALDEYGSAVGSLDDMMRPGHRDYRRLLDLDVEANPNLTNPGEGELGALEPTGKNPTRGGTARQSPGARRQGPGAAGVEDQAFGEMQNTAEWEAMASGGRPAQTPESGPYRLSEEINARGKTGPRNAALDDALNAVYHRLQEGRPLPDGNPVIEVPEAGPVTKNIKKTARDTVPRGALEGALGRAKTVKDINIPGVPGPLTDISAPPTGMVPPRTAREAGPLGALEGAAARADAGADTTLSGRPRGMPSPHLDAIDFWQTINRAEPARRVADLSAEVGAVLDRLEAVTGGKLSSPVARAFAEEMGINMERVNGQLAQRAVHLWATRKLAEGVADSVPGALGRVKGKASLPKKAARAAVVGWGRRHAFAVGGALAAGPAGVVLGAAADAVLHGNAAIASAAGRLRNAAVIGMSKLLSSRNVRALGLAVPAVRASYDAENGRPADRDFIRKSEDLRMAMGNEPAVRQRVRAALRDVGALDPVAAVTAEDSAVRRLKNLAVRLPVFMLQSAGLPASPPDPVAVQEWELYEAITHDRSLVLKLAAAGRVTPIVGQALAEQHPDYRAELLQYVLDHPDEMARAPQHVQESISELLGVPLVPEADPLYVIRQQASYEELRQKTAGAQQAQAGAAAVRGGLGLSTPAAAMASGGPAPGNR